jgi:adenosine deaminase
MDVRIDPAVDRLIAEAPKVELHIHLEGSLEPEMLLALADRNGVAVPWRSVDELREVYEFTDLQTFLDLYYRAASVLIAERDFYELTTAYLDRCAAEGVVHVEPFFDPQTHTARGIGLETVIGGISRALADGRRRHGITSRLIMALLRDQSEEDALATLDSAKPMLHLIDGIGLDSAELGNPPAKFARLYAAAREMGLHAVAHAGEEGPPSYVSDALDLLHVERIDHGVAAIDDPGLTARLARDRVTLTVCPFSNVKLRVVDELATHPLKRMLDAGLAACVNSDDPAYFGGYLVANLRATAAALELTPSEVARLLGNAIRGSWLQAQAQTELLLKLDEAWAAAVPEA